VFSSTHAWRKRARARARVENGEGRGRGVQTAYSPFRRAMDAFFFNGKTRLPGEIKGEKENTVFSCTCCSPACFFALDPNCLLKRGVRGGSRWESQFSADPRGLNNGCCGGGGVESGLKYGPRPAGRTRRAARRAQAGRQAGRSPSSVAWEGRIRQMRSTPKGISSPSPPSPLSLSNAKNGKMCFFHFVRSGRPSVLHGHRGQAGDHVQGDGGLPHLLHQVQRQ